MVLSEKCCENQKKKKNCLCGEGKALPAESDYYLSIANAFLMILQCEYFKMFRIYKVILTNSDYYICDVIALLMIFL